MSTPDDRKPENQGARPAAPISIADAEVAANYVEAELHRAATSRNITAIVGSLLVLAALIETLYVGGNMANYLKPRVAAQTASGLISQRIDDQHDAIQSAIAQRLPEFISQIPQQAIAQMPTVRENLEKTAITDLNQYAKSSSTALDTQLTSYLSSHKDEVHAALTSGKDSAAVHTLATGFSQQFVQSLQTQQDDGETLQQKLDDAQNSLATVKGKLDRLAANKNLTPDEKRTRHIVALMVRSINEKTPALNVNQAITTAQTTIAQKL